LRVLKMRGVKFQEGYHDYAILTGGLRIFPRLIAAEHHFEFPFESVSSGIEEMDELFGGGLDRGTTTLIIGQAGTGKSTIALQYATQMANRGDKSMIFAFDETRGVMLRRAKFLGLDLEKHVQAGTVIVQQVDPAELSPGEFAVRILKGVADGAKLVVIDSLSGYLNSMPGEKYLNSQMHELCSALNQQGVVTILIVPQHGLMDASSPVDLSYLADAVVSVRFFEALGEVKQALSVIKKRSGHHERTIREFKMEPGRGLRVGEVLKNFQGVLTGVPIFHGTTDQMMKAGDAPK
jgi:circadian clock protein KaiC